jgi:hypothetical protein
MLFIIASFISFDLQKLSHTFHSLFLLVVFPFVNSCIFLFPPCYDVRRSNRAPLLFWSLLNFRLFSIILLRHLLVRLLFASFALWRIKDNFILNVPLLVVPIRFQLAFFRHKIRVLLARICIRIAERIINRHLNCLSLLFILKISGLECFL